MLILKGLSQKIFSALPAISKENREQTINFSDDWQGIKERFKRDNQARESKRESLRNLFIHSKNNHQQPLIIASKQRMSSVH